MTGTGLRSAGGLRRAGTLAALLVALLAAGCAVYPGTARPAAMEDLRAQDGWTLLDGVPEMRQVSEVGCGAACLAMVLGRWGFEDGVEALEAECAGASTQGIRASALRDAARRRGLSAYLLAGTVADLDHELSLGRPVLVGLAKPRGEESTAHFVVVVGRQAGTGRIAALDPGIGLTCDSREGFEGEWTATKGVMIAVFPPEVKAASVEREVAEGGAR